MPGEPHQYKDIMCWTCDMHCTCMCTQSAAGGQAGKLAPCKNFDGFCLKRGVKGLQNRIERVYLHCYFPPYKQCPLQHGVRSSPGSGLGDGTKKFYVMVKDRPSTLQTAKACLARCGEMLTSPAQHICNKQNVSLTKT